MTGKVVVISTFATEEDAALTVNKLVSERFIACGTLLPGARSIYRWQGKLQDDREVVVLMKTDLDHWPALRDRLEELHPYETPEILALPVSAGSPAYLAWLERQLDEA
ncbi:MAG: divalent-cation tolerance protein CutA [Candidatus Eisenbacteria bacterium]|nr:divalent-cation tolerance protein CutA [Candidatus Eisenbacteria bacterium]